MADLTTNRDLYLALEALADKHQSCDKTLEQYLISLLQLAMPFSHRISLGLQEFYTLLAESFSPHDCVFVEDWRTEYDSLKDGTPDFAGWRAMVIRQIVDLREMEENNTFNNKYRYFGVSAPRGSRWYNFDPIGYLECAMAGSFGGWEPEDTTGRQFVPGTVAVLENDGSVKETKPEDLPRPEYAIQEVTWDQFKDFIYCGQIYE